MHFALNQQKVFQILQLSYTLYDPLLYYVSSAMVAKLRAYNKTLFLYFLVRDITNIKYVSIQYTLGMSLIEKQL